MRCLSYSLIQFERIDRHQLQKYPTDRAVVHSLQRQQYPIDHSASLYRGRGAMGDPNAVHKAGKITARVETAVIMAKLIPNFNSMRQSFISYRKKILAMCSRRTAVQNTTPMLSRFIFRNNLAKLAYLRPHLSLSANHWRADFKEYWIRKSISSDAVVLNAKKP